MPFLLCLHLYSPAEEMVGKRVGTIAQSRAVRAPHCARGYCSPHCHTLAVERIAVSLKTILDEAVQFIDYYWLHVFSVCFVMKWRVYIKHFCCMSKVMIVLRKSTRALFWVTFFMKHHFFYLKEWLIECGYSDLGICKTVS